MDREYILSVARNQLLSDKLLKDGDEISESDARWLYDNGYDVWNVAFAPNQTLPPGKRFATYLLNWFCDCCSRPIKIEASKTAIMNYFSWKNIYCPECQKQKEEEQRLKDAQKKEEDKIKHEEDVVNFINTYLKPNSDFPSFVQRRGEDHKTVWFDRALNDQRVVNHIRSMPYRDFLTTPYWRALARHIKYKANYKCALCGGKEGLSVHHRVYDHHGLEYTYDEDLICLCRHCHSKHHGIMKTRGVQV